MAVVFSKLVTITDTTIRLEVPTRALQHLHFPAEKHSVNLSVTDSYEQVWAFRCFKRQKGYAKPAMTGDWLPFVRSRGVRAGDRVIFRKLHGGEYRIEVARETNLCLFGQKVWVPL